jgi:iron complex outermembrane receptor protein
VVLRATVENALDKNYWIMSGNYATVSAPRTFLLSGSVDF